MANSRSVFAAMEKAETNEREPKPSLEIIGFVPPYCYSWMDEMSTKNPRPIFHFGIFVVHINRIMIIHMEMFSGMLVLGWGGGGGVFVFFSAVFFFFGCWQKRIRYLNGVAFSVKVTKWLFHCDQNAMGTEVGRRHSETFRNISGIRPVCII